MSRTLLTIAVTFPVLAIVAMTLRADTPCQDGEACSLSASGDEACCDAACCDEACGDDAAETAAHDCTACDECPIQAAIRSFTGATRQVSVNTEQGDEKRSSCSKDGCSTAAACCQSEGKSCSETATVSTVGHGHCCQQDAAKTAARGECPGHRWAARFRATRQEWSEELHTMRHEFQECLREKDVVIAELQTQLQIADERIHMSERIAQATVENAELRAALELAQGRERMMSQVNSAPQRLARLMAALEKSRADNAQLRDRLQRIEAELDKLQVRMANNKPATQTDER